VSSFKAGDAFYEQAESVEAAMTDIVAIRQQYQEGGYAAISEIGGTVHTGGQHEHENVANSSLQDSFAGLSIAAPPPHIGGYRKAFQLGNHLLSGNKPRNFAKGTRKDRHRQHSNQAFGVSNSNVYKESNRFNRPGLNRPVPHNSFGFGGTAQQASNMVAQGRKLPAPPVLQPGFCYNSFGASMPAFVPQHASNMTVQGPTLPTIQMPQSGYPFNPQAGAWNVAAEHNSRATARGPTLPAIPAPQRGFSVNPQAVGWNVSAAQQASFMTAQGPTLYATSSPDPSYYGPSFHMNAAQKNLIMAANGIKLPATYIPDPGLYSGPLHWLVAPIAQAIMTAAEGSQNPAFPFYRPRSQLMQATMLQPCALPPQCYIPGTSQMDIHIAECNRHTELMQEVLAIQGDPEQHEAPMTWYRILGAPRLRREQPVWHPAVIDLYGQESQYEQLLVRDINHRNNNEKGVGRKNAPGNRQNQADTIMKIDTGSLQASQQDAIARGGLESQETPAIMHARHESEETSTFFRDRCTPSSSHTNIQYLGYTLSVKRHEDPSPEISPTPPSRGRSTQAFAGKTPLNFNRSLSATHGEKRGFSATRTPLNFKRRYSGTHEEAGESSASKTPLLDFDSRYSAKHGEGDDVDFALRDLGPPRIGGKTFNEAVGYTPSPERRPGSPTPLFYPMNVRRRQRD
jgi:hypothetical protein